MVAERTRSEAGAGWSQNRLLGAISLLSLGVLVACGGADSDTNRGALATRSQALIANPPHKGGTIWHHSRAFSRMERYSFQELMSSSAASVVYDLAAGDVNGDGVEDLAVAGVGANPSFFDIHGVWHIPSPYSGPYPSGSAPRIALGNLIRPTMADKVDEFVYADGSEFSGAVNVFSTGGEVTDSIIPPGYNTGYWRAGNDLATCDLDADGVSEVVIANWFDFWIFGGIPDPHFSSFPDPGDYFGGHVMFSPTSRITCADLNGDGFDDVIVGNQGECIQIFSYPGRPVPTFDPAQTPATDCLVFDQTEIAAGDLDGDGFAEIVTGRDDDLFSGSIQIWTNFPHLIDPPFIDGSSNYMYDSFWGPEPLAISNEYCREEDPADSIDNDCDGEIDECAPGVSMECTVAPPVPAPADIPASCGPFHPDMLCPHDEGTQVCQADGTPGTCASVHFDSTPEIENCQDDDCDGKVDECNPDQLQMDCTAPVANYLCGTCVGANCTTPGTKDCTTTPPGPCLPLVTEVGCLTEPNAMCPTGEPGVSQCDDFYADCAPFDPWCPAIPECEGITEDSDGDEIPDCWEIPQRMEWDDGSVLLLPGANHLHKDIYIEIDYMPGHYPNDYAIRDLIDAFEIAPVWNPDGTPGITVHVEVSDEIPHRDLMRLNPCPWYDLGDCEMDLETIKEDYLGTDDGSEESGHRRAHVYHYVIFAHSPDPDEGGSRSSGRGERPGNDLILFGGGKQYTHPDVDRPYGTSTIPAGTHCNASEHCRFEQANTLMHELGHNLNLQHGGDEEQNCEPNYQSTMNYLYDFLDYSHGDLVGSTLDERALIEADGVGPNAPGNHPWVLIGPERPACPKERPADGLCPIEDQRCDYFCALDATGALVGTDDYFACEGGRWIHWALTCGTARPWPPQTSEESSAGPINWNRNYSVDGSTTPPTFVSLIDASSVNVDVNYFASFGGDGCNGDGVFHDDHDDWNHLDFHNGDSEGWDDRLVAESPIETLTADVIYGPDEDHDNVPDVLDNCRLLPNPHQTDTNGDAVGDGCDIIPVPECIDALGGGAYRAGFGYYNRYRGQAHILPGPTNGFLPGPDDRRQVRNFFLGRQRGVFQAEFTGPHLVWLLGDLFGAAIVGTLPECSDDEDGDGISNLKDNCPSVANEDQADLDADGIGDVCPDDDDADDVLDVDDNCRFVYNPDQEDFDEDGLGDVCDPNSLVADAGDDQVLECVNGGALATLDGSGSGAPFGTLDYAWDAPGVTLDNADETIATGVFPLGDTTATLTVSQEGLLGLVSAEDDVLILVADTTPPILSIPPDKSFATCQGVSIGTATAVDTCGSAVTITNNAPSTFRAGVHVVTWRATDAAGNVAEKQQRVIVGLGDSSACCPAGTNVILGNSNNNNLVGTSGSDCIIGLGAQDTISGQGGNDFLSGGQGDDVIQGGLGNDFIEGGTGQDTLRGQDHDDAVLGGDGDDWCYGDAGNDLMSGGQGQDRLDGAGGNDELIGDNGDDRLDGGAGNDSLDGGGLHDLCYGGSGTSTYLRCENQSNTVGPVLASIVVTDDWGGDYCAEIVVTNPTSQTASAWGVTFEIVGADIYDEWNGLYNAATGTVTVIPSMEWNQDLDPGEVDATIGFCAHRTVSGSPAPSWAVVEATLH